MPDRVRKIWMTAAVVLAMLVICVSACGNDENNAAAPNASPSDCTDDQTFVITCACGEANGCSGEYGRCLPKCSSDDECGPGSCADEGYCRQLCG